MDEATRLEYLKVMGVECWRVRDVLEHNTEAVEPNQMETEMETETETETILTPDNWKQLKQDVHGCQQCALCQTRTQTVFGEGNPQADWLFIGEAPGAHEDLQGKPFAGTAGFLLTEMIRAMGLTRERIFITNILKCRPPDNRDPNTIEIATCQAYLN
ncbi:MAG: uracil-DNA glycosylase, partial [Methylococcales bacterium]|nr:uracil-DNA glycosylase [Methylococcales bacterium]